MQDPPNGGGSSSSRSFVLASGSSITIIALAVTVTMTSGSSIIAIAVAVTMLIIITTTTTTTTTRTKSDQHHRSKNKKDAADASIGCVVVDNGVVSSIAPSLTCAICMDVFINATSLRCGHTFCLTCIEQVFLGHGGGGGGISCPCCRCQFPNSKEMVKNLAIRLVIPELKEFIRQSRIEKQELEASNHFLIASNQTLQESLDLQNIGLEEAKNSRNALELDFIRELSKLESELEESKKEKTRLKQENEILRNKVRHIESMYHETLEVTLRDKLDEALEENAVLQQQQTQQQQHESSRPHPEQQGLATWLQKEVNNELPAKSPRGAEPPRAPDPPAKEEVRVRAPDPPAKEEDRVRVPDFLVNPKHPCLWWTPSYV